MQKIGEVVVERGFAMTVALGYGQRERGLGQFQGAIQFAPIAVGEREIVERRGAQSRVPQRLAERRALLQLLVRLIGIPARRRQDAENVARLRLRVQVICHLRQLQRAARQPLRLVRTTLLMRGQTPIRVDSRALTRRLFPK